MGQGAQTQEIRARDSASVEKGDASYCGNRIYTLLDPITGLTLTDSPGLTAKLTLEANSLVQWSTITIAAGLEEYPNVAKATTTFTVEVLDSCLSAELEIVPLADMTAIVDGASKT